jgi:uncharacterized integral membrane protein
MIYDRRGGKVETESQRESETESKRAVRRERERSIYQNYIVGEIIFFIIRLMHICELSYNFS